jgi:hypothetical protein
MLRAIILSIAAIVIGAFAGVTRMTSERQAPTVRVLHCALAIPPPQVAKTPRLEPVYCSGSVYAHCNVDIGWIVVSEPVPCE